MDNYIRIKNSGKILGELFGDTLICRRNSTKHMMTQLNENAWCLDQATMEELAELGVVMWVRFEDPWNYATWSISFEDFMDRGRNSVVEFGNYGPQLRVWERYFNKWAPKQTDKGTVPA